jgi:hypothetical protein
MKVQLLEESGKAEPTHPLLGQQQKPNFIRVFPSYLYGLLHFCSSVLQDKLGFVNQPRCFGAFLLSTDAVQTGSFEQKLHIPFECRRTCLNYFCWPHLSR